MSIIIRIAFSIIALLIDAGAAEALEQETTRVRYHGKHGPSDRLDACWTLAKGCDRNVPDTFCRYKGYEKALKWEMEHVSPTRTMWMGHLCEGAHCASFKSIVCFTSKSQPGKGITWPEPMD